MATVRAQIEAAITAMVAALPNVLKAIDDPIEMVDEIGRAQGEQKHLALIGFGDDQRMEGGLGIEAFRFEVEVCFALYVNKADEQSRDVADALLKALYLAYMADRQWSGLAYDTICTSFASGVFMDDYLTKGPAVIHSFDVVYRFTEGNPEVPR